MERHPTGRLTAVGREQPRAGGAGTTGVRRGDIVDATEPVDQGCSRRNDRSTEGNPMTAQPTTPISPPPFPPQGAAYPQPYGQPVYGAGPHLPPRYPPPPAAGFPPADVRCPNEFRPEAGATFAGPATVDAQPVTYDVRQDDDQGHLTINYDRLLKVAEVESVVAQQVGSDVDVDVNVECPPADRTVVVNAPGTPIACTATNATDPSDSAAITVTVAADGTP